MSPIEYLTARYDEEWLVADYVLMNGEAAQHDPNRPDVTVTISWNWALITEDSAGGSGWSHMNVGPMPVQVKADIEAKRAVLELVADEYPHVVILLLQPYADRPDFDPAWRV